MADLLAAIEHIDAVSITDLGCGSGLSTELLCHRWPDAQVIGIDSSPAMLARARERVATASFIEGDIASYDRGSCTEPDLLVANASLHWLGNHDELMPHLISLLPIGGTLAAQMPNNWNEPTHRLMRETAAEAQFAEYFSTLPGERRNLLSINEYYDCLCGGAHVDIWETQYHHVLESVDAIVDWFATTGLKPWVDALPEGLRDPFRARYRSALSEHYPTRRDGRVLMIMPRLFIVAQREK